MLAAAPRFALVALATAAATALLLRLAPRIGWTDAPRGADAARKLQRRAVPAVGGAALLVGIACAGWPTDADVKGWSATVGLLFLVGTIDDRAPLAPGKKALAQLVALVPFALGAAQHAGALAGLAALAGGFAAVNLLNTFDNADGALASLCALGFAAAAPLASAACLGFLPFNLDAARARNRASGAPSAYLGDAGAFVLAACVLAVPESAGVLVLPALDLARLAVRRWRTGSRPWIGDREHLAHRLARRGLGPLVVAAVQCAIAAPACVLGPGALARGDAARAALAFGLTAGLYLVALRAGRGALPCPRPGGSE